MPRKFVKYLQPFNLFSCSHCNTHIACLADLVSKTSLPSDNTSYFFNRTVNIRQGQLQTRKLLSGESSMVDLFCNVCGGGQQKQPLGWKYIRVTDNKMKFKEGLSIVEKKYIKKTQWIKQ